MDVDLFDQILAKVCPLIDRQDTNYPIVLSAPEHRSITLPFLDVGCEGSSNDACVFQISDLIQALDVHRAHVPPSDTLPNDDQHLPYFVVGDDPFDQGPWLQKPYPKINLTYPTRVFN